MQTPNNHAPINVLFLAAEAAPLYKVGGLGDVAGSLPVALRNLEGQNLDVRLVLPMQCNIRRKMNDLELVATYYVGNPNASIEAKAYLANLNGLPIYLIAGAPIPEDGPVYNASNPELDGEKYVFFSMAALELTKHIPWKTDIIHANDWHTAAAIYALQKKAGHRSKHIRSVITIHNLPFMGKNAEKAITEFGLPRSRDARLPKWGRGFPLPLGMLTSDKIVAVSPGYAKEILTAEFGCGLQDFLAARNDDLSGILNGLDTELWNPTHDPYLPSKFDFRSIKNREENKQILQTGLGLPVKPNTPLLIMVGRMDQQKGIDIAVNGLRQAAQLDWQVVILGTGDPLLETACHSLEAEFPERVRALIRFDLKLSHLMYAGGDVLLMPSRYEPCGLAQMIAMNYGCVPLARATGGLKDTIHDDPSLNTSTGFLFSDPTPDAFAAALQRALYAYPNRKVWKQIQKKGMLTDFGWNKSAAEYASLYRQLVGGES